MNDGGPAFPTDPKNHGYEGAAGTGANPGMSLLDYFAGQSLVGELARRASGWGYDNVEELARCYKSASAMLAERARRQS